MSESTCSSFDTEEATDFDCEVGKKCRDDDFLSPYINVYIYLSMCHGEVIVVGLYTQSLGNSH